MDDVATSLNHKSGYNVTDTYVKKDWSRIDKANRKVIDFCVPSKKRRTKKKPGSDPRLALLSGIYHIS